jgi:hypothetical protein
MFAKKLAVLALVLLCSLCTWGAEFKSKDLIGAWSGLSKDGVKISYEFHDDGSVIWLLDEPSFKAQAPQGLKAKYLLRQNGSLWEIDIFDFENLPTTVIFQGILQPTEDGKFKMDGAPANVAKRPSIFSEQTVIFSKAAD